MSNYECMGRLPWWQPHVLRKIMKYKVFIVALLLLSIDQTDAKIEEIKSMKELMSYLNCSCDSLVVFDIDSTLLRLDNINHTVPWFCNELDMLQKQSSRPRTELYRKLLSEREQELNQTYIQELQKSTAQQAEPIIEKIITKLINDKIPFLIETKRGFPHIEITNYQLKSAGIVYKSSPQWSNISCKLTERLSEPAYYDDGVLFVGLHNTKGDALKALLTKLNHKPKCLIAVDDQYDNLASFEKMAESMCIDFIGLRYGFLDGISKISGPHSFDPLNCGMKT